MARVVQGLSGLILAGILVHAYLLAVMLLQFYLGGADNVGAESWRWHEIWGYVLGVPILLLLVLTLVGRMGPRVIGVAALLAVLFAMQLALNRIRVDAPYLPMLYAVNGLAMMGLATAIDRSRHPDDDAEQREAGPKPDGDQLGPGGGPVNSHTSELFVFRRRIPTFDLVRGSRAGAFVDSHRCPARRCDLIRAPGSRLQAADLVRRPRQVCMPPRHARKTNDVRIDEGVKDEHVCVRQ